MSTMRWKMTWEILNGSIKEFLYVTEANSQGTERITVKKKRGRGKAVKVTTVVKEENVEKLKGDLKASNARKAKVVKVTEGETDKQPTKADVKQKKNGKTEVK